AFNGNTTAPKHAPESASTLCNTSNRRNLVRRVPMTSRIARQLLDRRPNRCMVAPHPDLRERMSRELARLRAAADPAVARSIGIRAIDRPGLNDGMIFPESAFP